VRHRPDRASRRKSLLAGYAGLAGFFVLEGLFRQPGSPSRITGSPEDRGTTALIVVGYGVASDLPLVARWLPLRPLPRAVAPIGLTMQAAGLAVRAWSMRALGRSYTRTLQVDRGDQAVVDQGPYRWVRHPGYLGSLMTWTGFGLASRSKVSAVFVPLLLGAVYHRRIVAEEELLRRDLPGYAAYCLRTRRLIPFTW
jgi:protein-S-isoprenylcysteine O-methyltransferase Ste14